ncbi:distal membrane-arm assembly complex protein 2-like [Mercenaria mercenaria]|uniref:distal membrane-arm assembly complex protein 2-like n=1 Tax=Mercenaria mercenaria TaxID=6596 RepID=UPI00234E6EDB|nr:distal membrane-arm assembly complex protein 2-like [Mercenaria mercenaria]
MALAYQIFLRGLQGQRQLLCATPCINSVIQKRGLFYKKRTYWKKEYLQWLYHDYMLNLQEIKSYLNKRHFEDIKEFQSFDGSRVTKLGPDLALAEVIIRLGGKVKFVDDNIWYQKFESGASPIPTEYQEGYRVEGIDASNVILLYDCLEFFNYLDHVRFIRLSKSKYVDDWYIEKISEICPNIEALDISDCPKITDNGLELIHRFKNLKVVDITNCHKIKCSEVICAHLEDFCPGLTVIGLDSLSKLQGSEGLHDHELETSRYMNWGLIMNNRLGLKNQIHFEKFLESQMEKLGIEGEKKKEPAQLGESKENDTSTSKVDLEHFDSEHITAESVNR